MTRDEFFVKISAMNTPMEVLSWNLQQGKTDGLNNPEIRQAIFDHEPAVAVFPEALPENGLQEETARAVANAGYDLSWTNYDDNDGRGDRHALAVIVKPELLVAATTMRAVGRTSLLLQLTGDTSFLGVHLDDRSEVRRSLQAERLVLINRRRDPRAAALQPSAIVAGDLNAMHRKGGWAPVLRAVEPLAYLLPSKNPDEKYTKLERLGSKSQRLTAMADGSTMDVFAAAGFTDADPHHRITMKQGPIGAQLDHIMYRGNVAVVDSTVVETMGDLSDHSLIHATLQ